MASSCSMGLLTLPESLSLISGGWAENSKLLIMPLVFQLNPYGNSSAEAHPELSHIEQQMLLSLLFHLEITGV